MTEPLSGTRAALVVLGMHRSGTSALTGVLSMLGADPGPALRPGQEGVNPKGFWEHDRIVLIHDDLLAAFNSSWDDVRPLPELWWRTPAAEMFRDRLVAELKRDFVDHSLWSIKDPRLCRLLPLWQNIFDELKCHPHFLISLRHPAEVARSLQKRDGLPLPESCLLWLSHMLEAEYHTRGQPRIFVTYEHLLAEWRKTADNIESTFSIHWPTPIVQATLAIDAFLDPSLHHHAGEIRLPDHPAAELALEAYAALSSDHPAPDVLDRLRQQTINLGKTVAPWSEKLPQLRHALALAEAQNALLLAETARIKSSVSWQITGPLRAAWNLLRRFITPSR
jgi:hypothetical protein